MDPHPPPALATALDQARRLVHSRYPGAVSAVLGGSTARGRATATSDLDIVLLLPDGEVTRRETLRHEGRVTEVFAHTRADLDEIFAADRASRRGTMLFLYAESVSVHDPHGHAATLRAEARAQVAAGPDPLTRKERDDTRYGLTDLLDDLADVRDRHEQLVIADQVLTTASALLTDHHRAWRGNGKWLPRRLMAADPVLGGALLRAHLTLAEHADCAPLTAIGYEILDLVGGPLREGHSGLWAERGENGG
ncbi:nucleotidyltransferase domain-containing protein [Streptomyces sp. NPDC001848]|uniref:nucleotidyltransferase domain-containing protein n=1 Tax=Streptomyces sp. NPDC001848 TaxID=3364618 RepID=UPI00367995B5